MMGGSHESVHQLVGRPEQTACRSHPLVASDVLQFVKPYFTPADMEKGTRWDNEISKELGQSQIGIIASSLPIPLFMQGYELPSMDWMKASSLKATNLIARCASVPTLGQVDDLISVDTEDHLLLTRQLDDEFQLLAGRMH